MTLYLVCMYDFDYTFDECNENHKVFSHLCIRKSVAAAKIAIDKYAKIYVNTYNGRLNPRHKNMVCWYDKNKMCIMIKRHGDRRLPNPMLAGYGLCTVEYEIIKIEDVIL